MTAALDLTQRHFTHVKGNITVIGTWLNDGETVKTCLALIRTGEEASEHLVPCVVTMDVAFLFDRSTHKLYPDWARQAALMGFEYAQAMRLTPLPYHAQRICELVEDHIDDLFAIPPYQPPTLRNEEAVIEVTITDRDSGKRVREVLL